MTNEEFRARLLAICELEMQANSMLNKLLNEFSENENSMTILEMAEEIMWSRNKKGDSEISAVDCVEALDMYMAHR